MKATNSEMSVQQKKAKFMEKALEAAEIVGEYEVTIKVYDGKISGTIQTKLDFNLQAIRDIVGETETTISLCDYGLEIRLCEEL